MALGPQDYQVTHNVCSEPEHRRSRLSLYCQTCDKYICTKCLIKNRLEHYDHEILEVRDLYQKAKADLFLNKQVNAKLHQKSRLQQSQTVE